jgi:hypothetical protein
LSWSTVRDLLIVLLARLKTGGQQLLVALEIELRALELRLVARLHGLRLLERRLERALIDLEQRIARLDLLALVEQHLGDLAVDAGAYRHCLERLHGAEPAHVNRHVLRLRRAGHDRNRGSGQRRALGRAREVMPAQFPQRRAGRRDDDDPNQGVCSLHAVGLLRLRRSKLKHPCAG